MQRLFRISLMTVALAAGTTLVGPAGAAPITIIYVGPNGGDSYHVGGKFSQVETMSWTQAGAYTGVNISALVGNIVGGPQTVDAYLTTALGPGAGVPLDTATVTVPAFASAADITSTTFFRGLSLGAGTYYLTLFNTDTSDSFNIRWATGATTTLGPGVSGPFGYFADTPNSNTANPWQSTFTSSSATLGFNVSSTPLPPSLLLLGSGLIGLFGLGRRRGTT